jgi:predicted enzyme related to lactoylglutathione lyase
MAAKKKTKKAGKPAKAAARKPATTKRAAAPKRAAAKKAAPKPAPKKKLAHPIVHWEIQSKNPAQLHSFYASAFGWKIDANNPMNYGMVASGGSEGIDGGIGGTQHSASKVLVYAAVPDINAILGRIQEHGGRTVMPREDIGPVVMALYEDPEGNLMGLIENA